MDRQPPMTIFMNSPTRFAKENSNTGIFLKIPPGYRPEESLTPNSGYLSRAIWIKPKSVEVVIEDVPKYEQLAPKFKQLHENGASIRTIASAHGICWSYAKEILDFAKTGIRPRTTANRSF
jgi:hypothetical protein